MTNEEVMLANKRKNVDLLKAFTNRMGIGRPMPRTAAELAALVGRNPLVETETVQAVDDSCGSTLVAPEEVETIEIPVVVDDKPSAIPEQELIVVEAVIISQYDVDAKPTSGPVLTCREILAEAGLPGGKVNANALATVLARLGFQLYSSNGKKGYRLQGVTG